jgi:hypothetical protein
MPGNARIFKYEVSFSEKRSRFEQNPGLTEKKPTQKDGGYAIVPEIQTFLVLLQPIYKQSNG